MPGATTTICICASMNVPLSFNWPRSLQLQWTKTHYNTMRSKNYSMNIWLALHILCTH